MKKLIISTMFASLLLVLAACGGDDAAKETKDTTDGGESSAANTVELVASNWEFDKESYTVPAGEVTVKLANEEGFHGVKIVGTDLVIDGEGEATATLEPGEYEVVCTVPCGEGHETMTTKLIVE
ncbi:cupredoxin domain-containing protein [Paenisporosarcina antarctica]|uniref:Cytochrome C oxidase subunit II n=1 Tax=Paenisporosarcina antarctica TaxID=417367 RepID=A0A4P7A265_9BACL|nr:cytochrome C oxidase subunit II [Paenisporosarcina antarctica]QBP42813.1 cytochrome C oxidase subunit II [Paenisporosarcina antarctica]